MVVGAGGGAIFIALILLVVLLRRRRQQNGVSRGRVTDFAPSGDLAEAPDYQDTVEVKKPAHDFKVAGDAREQSGMIMANHVPLHASPPSMIPEKVESHGVGLV